MKTYRTTSGPFNERTYLEREEVERICIDELHATGLYPTTPSPIRVDRFIEKRFQITPRYEDLHEGVLGFPVFGASGPQDIVVARALDEEGTKPAERRIRTTLAHEAGHGLLHSHLFVLNRDVRPLFGDFSDPERPKILCRDVAGTVSAQRKGYDGRWWEFQANLAMGSLLMPRPLVEVALQPFLETRGMLGGTTLNELRRVDAVRYLAEVFDVNPAVAKIRIEELYPMGGEKQLNL
jgi:hypothetical protein